MFEESGSLDGYQSNKDLTGAMFVAIVKATGA